MGICFLMLQGYVFVMICRIYVYKARFYQTVVQQLVFLLVFLWISLLKIEFFINACSFYEGITFVIQLMLLIIVLVSWFKGFLF